MEKCGAFLVPTAGAEWPGFVSLALFCRHRRLHAFLFGEQQAVAVGVPAVQTWLFVVDLEALARRQGVAAWGSQGSGDSGAHSFTGPRGSP
jgi:hypothetical protein